MSTSTLPSDDVSRLTQPLSRQEALGLVIAWSAHEPARVGELALISPSATEPRVLGRGKEAASDPGPRAIFTRYRPERVEPREPLLSPKLSRIQLLLRAHGTDFLEVENVGRSSHDCRHAGRQPEVVYGAAAMRRFQDRYGPWALVAGASEGIGAEFARQIAAHGVHLILLALERTALERVAAEIRGAYGVHVRSAALDLGSPTLENQLAPVVAGLEVGLLVYNAAACPIGRFIEQNLEEKLRAIDVNCRAPVILAHRFGASMAERGRGGILLLSSMVAFEGTSMVATYAATKAFDLVLAEGLWRELGRSGVDVLACCPGPTRTPGYVRSTPRAGPRTMTPQAVVTEALDALGRQPTVVPGRSNRLASFLMRRILSRSSAIRLISSATERLYSR